MFLKMISVKQRLHRGSTLWTKRINPVITKESLSASLKMYIVTIYKWVSFTWTREKTTRRATRKKKNVYTRHIKRRWPDCDKSKFEQDLFLEQTWTSSFFSSHIFQCPLQVDGEWNKSNGSSTARLKRKHTSPLEWEHEPSVWGLKLLVDEALSY